MFVLRNTDYGLLTQWSLSIRICNFLRWK